MTNLIYQNWLIEETRLDRRRSSSVDPADPSAARIREAVRRALGQLEPDERRLLEWLYFLGRTYRDLSERTGRPIHRLRALRQRAFRKLHRILQPFVAREFGLRPAPERRCPICESDLRDKVDAIIAARDRRRTWGPVLRMIRERCRLPIRSPHVLITHETYHMIAPVEHPISSGRPELRTRGVNRNEQDESDWKEDGPRTQLQRPRHGRTQAADQGTGPPLRPHRG